MPTAVGKPVRVACDRCRAQKLRCIYNSSDQRSCDRCQRARVQCNHSPSLRMGRPPQKKKSHDGEHRQRRPSESASANSRTTPTAGGRIFATSMQEATSGTLEIGSVEHQRSSSWHILEMMDVTSNDAPISSSSRSANSSSSCDLVPTSSHVFPSSFTPADSCQFVLEPDMTLEDFDLSDTIDSSADGRTHTRSADLDPSDVDLGTPFGIEMQLLEDRFQQSRDSGTSSSVGPGRAPASDQRDAEATDILSHFSLDPTGSMDMEQHMLEKLSHLNVHLLQLTRASSVTECENHQHSTLQHTPNCHNKLSDSGQKDFKWDWVQCALEASQQFLDILTWFTHKPLEPSCSCTGSTRAQSLNKTPSQEMEYLTMSLSHDHETFSSAPNSSNNVANRPLSSGQSRKRPSCACHRRYKPSGLPPKLDIQTIFLMIGCHVRLLRLYQNLMTQMLHLLLDSSSDGYDSIPVVFLSRVQECLPIKVTGKLRAAFLVQIVVYMLNSIENALGCRNGADHITQAQTGRTVHHHQRGSPSAERSSRRNEASSTSVHSDCGYQGKRTSIATGLLHQCRSEALLELAIKHDDMESQEQGLYMISSLRDDIRRVRELLDIF